MSNQHTNSPPSEEPTPVSTSPSSDHKPQPQDDIEYPPLRTVSVIMLGIFICAFLVALDRTIIGTAIPTITNDFNSLGDVGWYASAYLLCMCGFQLLFGRIYTFFNIKIVYLTSIVIFEVGSAICGAAPSSNVFIFGRAIAGVGAAGIFSGAIPIFMYLLPLEKRPAWIGLFGMVFGIASIIAPLLGGAFTDGISWRWCFYINLPFGALAFIIIVLILHLPSREGETTTTWNQKLNQLDPIGAAIFFPCIVCLLLALQFGGVTYPWSNPRVIALLVLFAILLIIFIAVQFWRQEMATVPPRFLANRNVAAGIFFNFCIGSVMMVMVYFLPIWFQAIKGVSALKSGIMNIPMVMGLVIASIMVGILTQKIGYYVQWMYISCILMPIGAGMISTFTTTTEHNAWIGYQVLIGLGIGVGMQQPSVAVQTVLARKDIPTGISLCFFMQSLGGAMCTSISNNIFANRLAEGLGSIPGVDVGTVAHIGATDLRRYVPVEALPAVLKAYNSALVAAFYVGVAMAAISVIGVVPMQWVSIKKSRNSTKKGKDIEGQVQSPVPVLNADVGTETVIEKNEG